MENSITMHTYLKLDLNKQILKNLGCKTDAVCTHVHIPGGQCLDPSGIICETVVQ